MELVLLRVIGVPESLSPHCGSLLMPESLLRKHMLYSQTWIRLIVAIMVQCVGCRRTLKNGKAYSNHQRACKEYKAAGALRLRQMQLNNAKKVERARPIIQVTTDVEEPERLTIHDEHIQDLSHELIVVSYFSNYFSRLTLEDRKKLFLC